MKNILSFFIALYVGTMAFGQSINIDTKKATVSFNYVSEKTKGTLSGVEAQINIDPSNLASSTISGSVDVSTLSTKNKTRDQHLQSNEFFDAKKYPKMKFVATDIIKEVDFYKASGKLTIKDVTKTVKFKVVESDGVLIFKAVIYSSDFGISLKSDRAESKIYLSVKIPLN